MKFRLIIDKTKDEEVVATVHEKSTLTEQLEQMILQHNGTDKIPAYWEEDMLLLPFCQIECITVLDGKTYAADRKKLAHSNLWTSTKLPVALHGSTTIPAKVKRKSLQNMPPNKTAPKKLPPSI